jgi:hypothetical protein
LAARAHGNIKGGTAAIAKALEGMVLGEHHPMLIRLHLDAAGKTYPDVIDPRAGKPILAPPSGLTNVPVSERVS